MSDKKKPEENQGEISITQNGDIALGIGNNLGIDMSDGSLTLKVGPGLSIDLGGDK